MNRYNLLRGWFAGTAIALLLALVFSPAQAHLFFGGQLLEDSEIDEEIRSGCYSVVYEIQLEAGAPMSFELKSGEFDAYLILMDEEGNILAQDDNGGEGTNARIAFTPQQSGGYQLIVTTAKPGELGRYTVTISDDSDHGPDNPFPLDPFDPGWKW